MKSKYLEYIVVYLSVVIASVIVGVLARMIAVNAGVDDFTANIVFWVVTGLGIFLYCILTILIQDLITITRKLIFPNRNKNEKEILPPTEANEGQHKNFDKIREEQQQEVNKESESKKNIVIQYTQRTFAPYTTNEVLATLCNYIEQYLDNIPIENIQIIKVNKLTPLDIYHFGWNIWNYSRVSSQLETAHFLKIVFADVLKEAGSETIKSHMKDSERKGLIKIQADISI